jgi:hypothetical protein
MANRNVSQRLSDSLRNYIAKTVFTYTQTMGLTERHEIEGLTDKVISRLEKDISMDEQTTAKRLEPTLPGMEHLVAPIVPQPPSRDRIEIIAHKPHELAMIVDGTHVKIGEGGYEEKLERLIRLEEDIKNMVLPVDYIDLRFKHKAIVKPLTGKRDQ